MKNIITYKVNKNYENELYLSVQNGEVVIDAPWYYTKGEIQNIIEEKKNWILRKIKEYNENRIKDYIRNETVKLLGEDCKVIINYKNLKKPTLTVEGKNIKISLPNKYKKLNRDEILERLIEKLYDVVAEQELESIMEKVRKTLGFAPEDYKIKRLNNKMAECIIEEKIIIINPDIVKFDKETIEYILLHEFCHLKYKTHCDKFNKIIKENIVNLKKYERIIKEISF
jgi:predicted metal-dependent hydrolase